MPSPKTSAEWRNYGYDLALQERGFMRGRADPDCCLKCHGLGVYFYSTTATWRDDNFIAGQAITRDVCDECWGSGSMSRPWPSHREFERMAKSKT